MLEENKAMEEPASTKSSTGRQDEKTKGEKSGQTVTRTETRHYGLYNQGTTCYLNSVLQVLSMTTEIHDRLDPRAKETDLQLRNLFEGLKEGTCGTETIAAAFGIQTVGEQRDVAECLEMILREISPQASEVFQGELTLTTKCSNDHTIIEETNEFWTLPLSLKGNRDSSYSVESGFERIFQPKPLNGVYCNDCEETTAATSGCEMKVFPQILTLLRKRFDDNSNVKYFKSDHCVDVPRVLQRNDKKYELYAMVNHIDSLTGGHYTATIRSNEDNTWYEFNDSHVSKVKEQPFAETNSYNSGTVYLLMYRKAAPAAQRPQTYLNPWNWSPFQAAAAAQMLTSWNNFTSWFGSLLTCQKPDERRERETREADNEEKIQIRQLEEDEGPMKTGVKTGEEADAETIENDKSAGETSNDINMVTGENSAELYEVKSSGHEEKQEHLLTNADGAHSSITQENTNSKLGELKQAEEDDAPVNDEEESDSRGQDLDEETGKPKQREAAPAAQILQSLNPAGSPQAAAAAQRMISWSNLKSLFWSLLHDAPVNDEEEPESRRQDLDEETEKPKPTAAELQMYDETDSADLTVEMGEEEVTTL